MPSIITVQCAY